MLFRVENLGPLREAEVDLSKDLIVLTGPNNSGKTYLAWSLYGLSKEIPGPDSKSIAVMANEILRSPKHEIERRSIEAGFSTVFSQCSASATAELDRCFAAESGHFNRSSVALSTDGLTESFPQFLGLWSEKYLWALATSKSSSHVRFGAIDWQNWKTAPHDDDLAEMASSGALDELFLQGVSLPGKESAALFILKVLLGLLGRKLLGNCIIFPAERIAVNIFAKELALKRTELVDDILDIGLTAKNAQPLDVIKQRAERYPLPIRDCLRIANDLANISKSHSSFEDLAAELEMTVLGGKVAVSELGAITFSPDAAAESKLSVHLAASVVKSLSSLVFYFRHMAQKGDFLIIDEPELNLHPDNQRKISRILAKAVNCGFKIMMSTHSDYLIRELNHLIMLSQPSEAASKLIEELGYDPASTLKPEKVGVYLFNDHRSQPVPVTETGFEVKTIEDEINKLNAASQKIYSGLFD